MTEEWQHLVLFEGCQLFSSCLAHDVAEHPKIMLLKLHVLISLHLLLSHPELVDQQPDDATAISEVSGRMHDIEGDFNEYPEGNCFLAVIVVLANHADHHIAD